MRSSLAIAAALVAAAPASALPAPTGHITRTIAPHTTRRVITAGYCLHVRVTRHGAGRVTLSHGVVRNHTAQPAVFHGTGCDDLALGA